MGWLPQTEEEELGNQPNLYGREALPSGIATDPIPGPVRTSLARLGMLELADPGQPSDNDGPRPVPDGSQLGIELRSPAVRGSEAGPVPAIGPSDNVPDKERGNQTEGPSVESGPHSRGQRARKAPMHLQDYICYTMQDPSSYASQVQKASSGKPYPIANYVTCNNFSPTIEIIWLLLPKLWGPGLFMKLLKIPTGERPWS